MIIKIKKIKMKKRQKNIIKNIMKENYKEPDKNVEQIIFNKKSPQKKKK